MNRRSVLLGMGAVLVLPVPAIASTPVGFNVRDLESLVFMQVYDGYKRQKQPPIDRQQIEFYWDVRELLIRHFDTVEWPAAPPFLCVLPPDKYVSDKVDVLGGLGFVACGSSHCWEQHNGEWRVPEWYASQEVASA